MRKLPFVTFVFVFVACQESFSPTAPFPPQMVVYSVLDSERDTQYVRVYETYNAKGNDAWMNLEDHPVTDARVTFTQGSTVFVLRDTVVQRADKSRYQSDIRLYYVYPMRIDRDKQYRLDVSSLTRGVASAIITVPGKAELRMPYPQILGDPWSFMENPRILAKLAYVTKGFLVRLFIYYESNEDYVFRERRFEVPLKAEPINLVYDLWEVTFPSILRRATQPIIERPGVHQLEDGFAYPLQYYQWSIKKIWQRSYNLKFRRAVFYWIQLDAPLFNYYSVVNEFRDKYSVRTDQPDFTNLTGAAGLLGSMTVDSLVYDLPEFIPAEPPRTK